MIRKIVQIDEDKCNGCELCVTACHEGAIEMVEGKARLVSDIYCDGLGDCLPACPTDAIQIIERQAEAYSQEAVDERLAVQSTLPKAAGSENTDCGCNAGGPQGHHFMPQSGGCPGSAARTLNVVSSGPVAGKNQALAKMARHAQALQQADAKSSLTENTEDPKKAAIQSRLSTWPVQLKLVNPQAEYLEGADLLIAADCTAFAHGNFHREFISGRVALIGCPKLDDSAYYTEKIGAILKANRINSVTVVRMEVPCCSGITAAVKQAMLESGVIVKYDEVTLGLDGSVL